MRKLDLDLEYNEFDNFISKKGMSGLMKGIGAQIGACFTEISAENPEFTAQSVKNLSKSENTRYQALMKSCLESKKKKAPPKPKGGGIRHIRPTDYKGMAQAGVSASSIQKFKRAEQKRKDNLQVSTSSSPFPPTSASLSPRRKPTLNPDPSPARPTDPIFDVKTGNMDRQPMGDDAKPYDVLPPPTPDPVGEILDKKDKKDNMKTYLMIGAAVVVGFIIYKNV